MASETMGVLPIESKPTAAYSTSLKRAGHVAGAFAFCVTAQET